MQTDTVTLRTIRLRQLCNHSGDPLSPKATADIFVLASLRPSWEHLGLEEQSHVVFSVFKRVYRAGSQQLVSEGRVEAFFICVSHSLIVFQGPYCG